jgi:hypothetical protein
MTIGWPSAPRVAFVFGGQGTQHPRMGIDLYRHVRAFRDGESQRFFRIDVLFGLGRGDVDQAVPVVRGAIDDAIDVLALQHFAIVFEELWLTAILLLNGIDIATHTACVNIAESGNFDALLAH